MKLTIGIAVASIVLSLFVPEVREFLGIGKNTKYSAVASKTISFYGDRQSIPEFGIAYIRANSYPNDDKTNYNLGLEIRIIGAARSNERIVKPDYRFDYFWNTVNYRVIILSEDKEAASLKIQILMKAKSA
jgi:hypothetical protein